MKKNYKIVAVIIIGILASCKNDSKEIITICEVSNPIEDLTWLKTQVEHANTYHYYMMATYNNQTVFYNGNCNPAVNYQSSVYNCEGALIGYTNDLQNELKNATLLWKHTESDCDFEN
ncbi:hypothetical protein Q4595_10715 [Wenyingzhuangia sp. 1_MG-2023]|nr:hypothetical protein [Wenyingzhuangia sp. 1_MG-2023]